MNLKISGQSSVSNYKNNDSSKRAVFYDEHDYRNYLNVALKLGAQDKQMQFFDMEGHVVTAAEVLDKIDRHHSGLHKDDAKFFCIMLDPSDPEIAAMGETLTERLANGKQYVFDIMDAYARNFHREGIIDRHNLTAYAIPHLYKGKGKEKKDQLHWHIIVARKDKANKCKLSPLTNHRSTTKGVVKGGFDRVTFDRECEQLFDKRFGYERKVEESFDYCLAQKKGTPEQKAEQTQRLTEQNKPDLEAAVNAFLNQRVAQLAAEAAAKAEKERQEKEEAARKEAARLDRVRRNEFWNNYNSKYRPEYEKLKKVCEDSFKMYLESKLLYNIYSAALTEKYNELRTVYQKMDVLQKDIDKASTAKGIVAAVSALVFFLNPVAGAVLALVGGILAESSKCNAAISTKANLRAQAAAIKDSIAELKEEQAALRQDKVDRLKIYVENKEEKLAFQEKLNQLREALREPVVVEKPTVQFNLCQKPSVATSNPADRLAIERNQKLAEILYIIDQNFPKKAPRTPKGISFRPDGTIKTISFTNRLGEEKTFSVDPDNCIRFKSGKIFDLTSGAIYCEPQKESYVSDEQYIRSLIKLIDEYSPACAPRHLKTYTLRGKIGIIQMENARGGQEDAHIFDNTLSFGRFVVKIDTGEKYDTFAKTQSHSKKIDGPK